MHVSNRIAVEHALASHQLSVLKHTLAKETLSVEDSCRDRHFAEIIGTSAALRRVLQQVELVATTDATVLLYGETGTGKELLARALHTLSTRRAQAFVKLNCAAIPTGLLASELFGKARLLALWRNASAALSWPTITEYTADSWKVALCPVA